MVEIEKTVRRSVHVVGTASDWSEAMDREATDVFVCSEGIPTLYKMLLLHTKDDGKTSVVKVDHSEGRRFLEFNRIYTSV